MSFQLPYDLGRYVIERRHAAGGMATVFEGWQKPPMKRPVAVKIMHAHIAESPAAVERFEREAANCARVQHENRNTVLVYDYGILEPGDGLRLPYIVMEWIDGFDLKKWKEMHSPLPLEVALTIIHHVAVALKHAHGCQVIHRDLKPSNVMLTTDGRVKLMDFGLARAHDDKQLTDPGDKLGTAPYMSPEQTRGQELTGEDGERSDIFSMGTFCYELLANEAPFQGKGLADVLVAVANHEPRPVAERNRLVPPRFAETIERAMRKPPGERCSSMSEFLDSAEAAVKAVGIDDEQRLLARYMEDPEQAAKELARDRGKRTGARDPHLATPEPRETRKPNEKTRSDLHDSGNDRPREDAGRRSAGSGRDVDELRRRIRTALIALGTVVLLTIIVVALRRPSPPPRSAASLLVETVPPGASLRANGEASGTTPRTIVGLAGDTIMIELARVGFERYVNTVTLEGGMPALRVKLIAIPSHTYSISTSPGSADVYLDDVPGPLSWPMTASLAQGEHRFLVRHAGGERQFTYEVRAGDPAGTLVLHYDTGQLQAR